MLQVLQAVGQILSRLAELLGQVSGWLGQLLVVLMGMAGIVAGLALLLSVYIAFGALLEHWLGWAWNRKRQVWPVVVTVILWPVVAALGVAFIGAVPLAYKWWDMSVDWAIAIGLFGIVVSIMANNRFNPLDRPKEWIIILYRRIRHLRPTGVINNRAAGHVVGTTTPRTLIVGEVVTIFETAGQYLRIGPDEWVDRDFVDLQ